MARPGAPPFAPPPARSCGTGMGGAAGEEDPDGPAPSSGEPLREMRREVRPPLPGAPPMLRRRWDGGWSDGMPSDGGARTRSEEPSSGLWGAIWRESKLTLLGRLGGGPSLLARLLPGAPALTTSQTVTRGPPYALTCVSHLVLPTLWCPAYTRFLLVQCVV